MGQTSFHQPVTYYRCTVQSQIPIELHNVTMQQRSMFIAGRGSTIAWSAMGVAAMTLYGRARQRRLEGQVRLVPATGEATLTDDRIALRLVATGAVPGVRVSGSVEDRTMEFEIPYRLLARWGQTQDGVYVDIVRRDAIWIRPADNGEFVQWLAHLSHDKTWKPPEPTQIQQREPVVNWCQQDQRYTFGLPEGWGDPNPLAFAEYGSFFHPSFLRAMVGLNLGEIEAQLIVVEAGGEEARDAPTDVEGMATELAGATNIQPIGPIRTLALDGQPAVMMRGTSMTPDGVMDRTYVHVSRNGVYFIIWYGLVDDIAGSGNHERWLPAFETMLATWHWYG